MPKMCCARLVFALRVGLGLWCGLGFLLQGMEVAHAHEIQANRLTLIQRDTSHLSLRWQIDLISALQRTLEPKSEAVSFQVKLLSLPQTQFEAALKRTQSHIEKELELVIDKPKSKARIRLTPKSWRWPKPSELRNHLQQLTAAAVLRQSGQLSGSDHDHPEFFEVTAELVEPAYDLSNMTIKTPEVLGKVMLVYYRPRQLWLDPKASAAFISIN